MRMVIFTTLFNCIFAVQSSANSSDLKINQMPKDLVLKTLEETISESPTDIEAIGEICKEWSAHAKSIARNDPYSYMLSQIYNKHWLDQAFAAPLSQNDLPYLETILKVKDRLWNKLISKKEKEFTHPLQYKKHAISLLLAFGVLEHSVSAAAARSGNTWVSGAVVATARGILQYEIKKGEPPHNINPLWKRSTPPNVVHSDDVLRVLRQNIESSLIKSTGYVTASVFTRAAQNIFDTQHSLKIIDQDRSYHHRIDREIDPASLARSSDEELNALAHRAHKIGEVTLWRYYLNPKENFLEKTYQDIYNSIGSNSFTVVNDWFESKQVFESKIDQFFGKNSDQFKDMAQKEYEYKIKFFDNLLLHLKRIANHHIFNQLEGDDNPRPLKRLKR